MPRRPTAVALLLLAGACGSLRGSPQPALEHGMVVAPEPLAAEVGAQVLRDGGNAVDATVAVGFALAVTYPNAGNLGGGGFLLVHHDGEDVAVDCREKAPAAATRDMYLDADGNVIPGESLHTHRAAGVPGTVAGLWETHRRWGTRPWAELVAPAIRLAEEGYVLDEREVRGRAAKAGRPTTHASFHRYFGPPQKVVGGYKTATLAEGLPFVQQELAATLRRIAEHGRDGFYLGETARLVAEEMARGGGLITEEDLAAYDVKFREPAAGTFRGHRVLSMPPPSSGGAILVMMLGMLEALEERGDYDPASIGHNSAPYVHLVAEIEKRVFADRAEFFGDPDHWDVPLDRLLDDAYLRDRVADINYDSRTDPSTITAGAAAPPESEETTHYSVVDRWGNAVAHTTTLNAGYGSTIVVEGAGFLLNNEMDDFSAKPGVPNLYGAVGGDANAVAPGKRMLSSMSPTLVVGPDGRLRFVLGTPGGTTIFTTIFQVLVNRLDFGMSLEDAVAAPRFHHQWPPRAGTGDPIRTEPGARALSPETMYDLGWLGYARPESRGTIGHVQAIEIDRPSRSPIGVADPRSRGAARR